MLFNIKTNKVPIITKELTVTAITIDLVTNLLIHYIDSSGSVPGGHTL